jgi:hypothetical protein
MVFDVCSLASIPKTIPIPPKNSKKNDSFSSNCSIARDRVENCISRETGKLGKNVLQLFTNTIFINDTEILITGVRPKSSGLYFTHF